MGKCTVPLRSLSLELLKNQAVFEQVCIAVFSIKYIEHYDIELMKSDFNC